MEVKVTIGKGRAIKGRERKSNKREGKEEQ
jgi:hypothetical protein